MSTSDVFHLPDLLESLEEQRKLDSLAYENSLQRLEKCKEFLFDYDICYTAPNYPWQRLINLREMLGMEMLKLVAVLVQNFIFLKLLHLGYLGLKRGFLFGSRFQYLYSTSFPELYQKTLMDFYSGKVDFAKNMYDHIKDKLDLCKQIQKFKTTDTGILLKAKALMKSLSMLIGLLEAFVNDERYDRGIQMEYVQEMKEGYKKVSHCYKTLKKDLCSTL